MTGRSQQAVCWALTVLVFAMLACPLDGARRGNRWREREEAIRGLKRMINQRQQDLRRYENEMQKIQPEVDKRQATYQQAKQRYEQKQQAATAARQDASKKQRFFNTQKQQLSAKIDDVPAVAGARAEADRAQRAYEVRRAEIEQILAKQTAYQRLSRQVERLKMTIDEAESSGLLDAAQLRDTRLQLVQHQAERRDLLNAAIDADPQARQAKQRYEQAQQAYRQTRDEHLEKLQQTPAFQQAEQQLEEVNRRAGQLAMETRQAQVEYSKTRAALARAGSIRAGVQSQINQAKQDISHYERQLKNVRRDR